MGLGADAVLQLNNRMGLRAGFDWFDYDTTFDFKESGVEYHVLASLGTGSFSALFHYHLSSKFFASAGFAVNNFSSSASGFAISDLQFGDIVIPASDIGTFTFDVDPGLRISPYLGIGFGRLLGENRRLGMAFELGAFYQGSPQVSIQSDGRLSPTSNPAHGHQALLERQIDHYYLYPVVRLSLSVKILDSKPAAVSVNQ